MDASSAVQLFAFKTHVSESGGFHGFHHLNKALMASIRCLDGVGLPIHASWNHAC